MCHHIVPANLWPQQPHIHVLVSELERASRLCIYEVFDNISEVSYLLSALKPLLYFRIKISKLTLYFYDTYYWNNLTKVGWCTMQTDQSKYFTTIFSSVTVGNTVISTGSVIVLCSQLSSAHWDLSLCSPSHFHFRKQKHQIFLTFST